MTLVRSSLLVIAGLIAVAGRPAFAERDAILSAGGKEGLHARATAGLQLQAGGYVGPAWQRHQGDDRPLNVAGNPGTGRRPSGLVQCLHLESGRNLKV